MLAHIELPYSWFDSFRKMPAEEWEAVKPKLAGIFPTMADDFARVAELEEPVGEYLRSTAYLPCGHIVDLATDGIELSLLGLQYTVKRFKGAYMAEGRAPKPADVAAGTTNVVQVAIPDLALLNIRAIQVVEDACTQLLQGLLDKGWRILAICPPHAQRRPDYILGHVELSERIY